MKKRTGRNTPCPCKSGKKFKHCCLKEEKEYLMWERRRQMLEQLQSQGMLRIPTKEELDGFEAVTDKPIKVTDSELKKLQEGGSIITPP